MNDKLKIFKEDFKDENGQVLKGVTILLDGKLKETIDLLLDSNQIYNSEEDLVLNALLKGLKEIHKETFYYN